MAIDGFTLFGADKFANLMKKVNSLYNSIRGKLAKFNVGTKESFSKSYDNNPLNDLDTIFYALYKDENLSKLRIDYIRSHVNEFIQK